ncbi:hypothetical protein JXA56_05850 [Candidatus Micrarchaeota archaeon]|nr:hypothetical protein [Candidatus Micrarchaeota archaeon]
MNNYIVGGAAIIIIILLVMAAPGKYDNFAQCLTNSGVKMYGTYWCGHCKEQKDMFGKSWDKIIYVECSLPNAAGQTQQCIDSEIFAYPTWELGNGERITGAITFEELSLRTGCLIVTES